MFPSELSSPRAGRLKMIYLAYVTCFKWHYDTAQSGGSLAILGATLRSLRTRVGFSQEELAQLVGSSQAEISRMERGRSQLIRPTLLVRLASVLGVSPSALLPEAPSGRTDRAEDGGPAEIFRVGFWESVWTAPLIALSEERPNAVRLASRVRVGSLYKVINPEVQIDPRFPDP